MSDAKKMPGRPSVAEVQQVVWDTLLRSRDGEFTPSQAGAITNAAGKILTGYKLEIEYQRLSGRKVNIAQLNGGEE